MSTSQVSSNAEVPSHRACAHCRSQKVRCIVDESNPDVCQRCARSGRPCVFTALPKRKQRKRTDTRVTELEREMRIMQSKLKNKDDDHNAGWANAKYDAPVELAAGLRDSQNTSSALSTDDEISLPRSIHSAGQQQSSASVQQRSPTMTSLPTREYTRTLVDTGKDVIERGIISMATARQLFETYRAELFSYYPLVPVPETISADHMRNSKPLLFLAIIAAAAGKDNPEISARLDQEALHAYVTNNLIHSQKSVEIVQALLISSVWYSPPSKFGQLKYYEYIHMAANMAADIGIASGSGLCRTCLEAEPFPLETRSSLMDHVEGPAKRYVDMARSSGTSNPESGNIESRRTFLSCYCACTGASISLRRSSMLRASTYIRECVNYLEHSSDALPSDRMLAAWVRLLMISEEISNAFSHHDPGDVACITELRTQLMLKDFAKRLDNWFKSISRADMSSSLVIYYWATRLYLYEVVLYLDYSPEDFKAPFRMGVIQPWHGDEVPTEVLAETVAECVSCSHNLINAFLAVDVDSLCALPVLIYLRTALAVFVLVKLCLSANHPGSQIGRVLDQSKLRAESILDRTTLRIRAVLERRRCRTPAIFLAVLFKLRKWCLNPELIEPPQGNLLDDGMQNPIDVRGKETQPQSSSYAGGTRFAEQSGTDNGSPHTSSDSYTGAHETLDQTGHGIGEHSSIQPSHSSFASLNTDSNPVTVASNGAAPIVEAEAYPGQVDSFLNVSDQMELDQNFFQFFEGMVGLGEATSSGFDDWSTLSVDILGLPNNSQNATPDDQAPRL